MLPTIATGNVASALAGEYEVANSLRFDDGSTDYLNGSGGAGATKTKFTFSVWVKRSNLASADDVLLGKWSSGNDRGHINFSDSPNDSLIFFEKISGSTTTHIHTNRLFRDVSAWYHIVYIGDTTQATASNRLKLYVNGVQETSFATATYPSQNSNWQLQALTQDFGIGAFASTNAGASPFSGYMAEIVYLDGIAGSIGDFGEFDSDTNIWKPIDVSGLTFGTNGFYLDFENSGSLGADVSGNGNNFTVNNLTSIDQTTDTCTNNFATLNPLEAEDNSPTYSDGNLTQTTPGLGGSGGRSTFEIPHTGVWYWEVKIVSTTGTIADHYRLGIATGYTGSLGENIRYMSNGQYVIPGSANSYGASYQAGDIIGVKVDADNNQVTFYKNGASQGAISYTMVAGETYKAIVGEHSNGIGGVYSMNFGNPPFSISSGNSDPEGYGNFEYSTDSGYALCTKNLAEYG
jgi:hypothetical protein